MTLQTVLSKYLAAEKLVGMFQFPRNMRQQDYYYNKQLFLENLRIGDVECESSLLHKESLLFPDPAVSECESPAMSGGLQRLALED